jgi:hypothetical protein
MPSSIFQTIAKKPISTGSTVKEPRPRALARSLD